MRSGPGLQPFQAREWAGWIQNRKIVKDWSLLLEGVHPDIVHDMVYVKGKWTEEVDKTMHSKVERLSTLCEFAIDYYAQSFDYPSEGYNLGFEL